MHTLFYSINPAAIVSPLARNTTRVGASNGTASSTSIFTRAKLPGGTKRGFFLLTAPLPLSNIATNPVTLPGTCSRPRWISTCIGVMWSKARILAVNVVMFLMGEAGEQSTSPVLMVVLAVQRIKRFMSINSLEVYGVYVAELQDYVLTRNSPVALFKINFDPLYVRFFPAGHRHHTISNLETS
jgi:hypothetical protein